MISEEEIYQLPGSASRRKRWKRNGRLRGLGPGSAGVGKNVKKRFVALFPTDVRYDTNDAAQVADYKELSDYVHKIGEGAVNSPFQTEDSD